jgi:uncharacterized membrane protein YdjX (TVP38/TMEM64 family)
MARAKTTARIVGLVVLAAILLVVTLAVDAEELVDPDRLRAIARDNLWKASALFLAAGAGIKLLFMPVSPLSLLAGAIFGGPIGALLTMITLTASSTVAFGAARWLGRDWVRHTIDLKEGHAKIVDRLLEHHGLLAVVVLRVVPTLPLSAVNMLLGLSAVRWRDFVLGTVLGLAPGTLLLAYVGSEALDPGGFRFWLFLSLFALLVLAGIGAGYWMRRRMSAKK